MEKIYIILAGIVAGILGLLGVYLKGRGDGKAKGNSMLKDAELAAKNAILKDKEKNAKANIRIKDVVDSLPDKYTE